MLIRDIVQKTTQFFKEKGISSARLDTELLLSNALGWDRVKLYMNLDYPLDNFELDRCRNLVRRRSQGEPIAYILGSKDFFKHTFHVEPGVLIPRPETETLVEEAIKWANKHPKDEESIRIVDFGCGSGCIGLSLLSEIPNGRLLAVDISEVAMKATTQNADLLNLTSRVQLLRSQVENLSVDDVIRELGGRADIVVANPPYIANDDPDVEAGVVKFEPHEALFSGENGLEHIRNWSSVATKISNPGAMLMFEMGAEQKQDVLRIFSAHGNLVGIEVVQDLSGRDRFIRCELDKET